jgi:hypothetical protein
MQTETELAALEAGAEDTTNSTQIINPPLANTVTTSSDGHRIASGLGNGDILIWTAEAKHWRTTRCTGGHYAAVTCV